MFQAMGKMFIIFGGLLLAIGALLYFGGKLGIGRLPGDIVYRKGSFTFYFPIITSLVLSLLLTLLLNLLRFRK